ncbi:hypothetical protein [Campylobacter sp.]|uniref:hypothetical protein n=1 Tax=Campylobacter sp. TaxID=205 RepID=UPI002AA74C40|nr:hypothetical protein [Campylobacter sp.]MCI6660785.1 hypothetical protein [Campylobacter sp.]
MAHNTFYSKSKHEALYKEAKDITNFLKENNIVGFEYNVLIDAKTKKWESDYFAVDKDTVAENMSLNVLRGIIKGGKEQAARELLSIIEFAQMLGYEEDMKKTCLSWRFFSYDNDGEKDKVFFHFPQSNDSHYVKTGIMEIRPKYMIHSKPDGNDFVNDFEIGNNVVRKIDTPRKLSINPKTHRITGGDILNFAYQRFKSYSKSDILNMLYDIARDRGTARKYDFARVPKNNANYKLPTYSQLNEEKKRNWEMGRTSAPFDETMDKSQDNQDERTSLSDDKIIKEFEGYKEYVNTSHSDPKSESFKKLVEDYKDVTIRGIPFIDFIIAGVNSKIKVLFRPLNHTSPLNGLIERVENIRTNAWTISCPSSLILINEEDKKGRIAITGDLIMPVLTDNFFDELSKNKKTFFSAYPALQDNQINDWTRNKLKETAEKISKQKIPSSWGDDEYKILASLFCKNNPHRVETTSVIDNKKPEYINGAKLFRPESTRGATILMTPAMSEVVDPDKKHNILIVENPLFDGISALKLGYIKTNTKDEIKTLRDYNTTILGTCGNPTKNFYDVLYNLIQRGKGTYNKVYIGTDGDEAGKAFNQSIKTQMAQKISSLSVNIMNIMRKFGATNKNLYFVDRYPTITIPQFYTTSHLDRAIEDAKYVIGKVVLNKNTNMLSLALNSIGRDKTWMFIRGENSNSITEPEDYSNIDEFLDRIKVLSSQLKEQMLNKYGGGDKSAMLDLRKDLFSLFNAVKELGAFAENDIEFITIKPRENYKDFNEELLGRRELPDNSLSYCKANF